MTGRLDEHVRAFLAHPYVAVLATVSPAGRAQATPVWFAVEGDLVLVNTSIDRVKLRNVRANPHVALVVVDPQNIYRYVQVQGAVERIDREHGARDIDRLAVRYTGRPYTYRAGDRPEDRVSLYIRPRRVSGFRA